ncbi:MAG: hypothetical protein ACLTW9_22065 [Enterocloster sp.]
MATTRLWRWRLGRDGSRLDRIEGIGAMEGAGSMEELWIHGRLWIMEVFGTMEGPGTEEGGTLVSTEVLELTIEQLTAWLLGYRALDAVMEADSGEIPYWWRYVRPLRGVFLDEVV